MTRRRLLVGALVLVVVGATALAVVAWPRGGDPVSTDDAVADFRTRRSTTTEGPEGEPTGSGARTPKSGVYTFVATGREAVKLGALPAEERPYPGTVPVTVVNGEEGCFTVTVDALVQHSEDTTYCVTDDGGLRLGDHRKHQTVGPMEPTATMTCDEDLLVTGPDAALDADDALDLSCRLELSGGPARLEATVTGTSRAEATTVDVDGEEVEATVVSLALELDGDLSGTWDEDIWFAVDDRLPLRIERDLELSGLASFTETSELRLRSLTPDT